MFKKMLFYLTGIIAVLLGGGMLYLYTQFPAVEEAPVLTVDDDSELVERGRYLANHVAVCMDCHSQRDFTRFSGPISPGTDGMGGDMFNHDMGFPGTFYAKNITPASLAEWTDGEIYRTITTGVNRDGEALFPVMPYLSYGRMDPKDVEAIIAYIRTLQPIENEIPESEADFPMNLIMRTIPQPASPMERPDPADTVEYGRYMITISACGDCHTPVDRGTPIENLYMAGGREFRMPWGTVRSGNITPHPETGIGRWTKEQFIERFKMYDLPADSLPRIPENRFNSLMPWAMYGGMAEEDLGAIFEYLQSIEPVENRVTMFTPAASEGASR